MQSKREKERPMSVMAARIVRESLQPDVSLSALGKLAESDPAFAVRLLAVVNSGAFGLGKRVADVPHAVTLLGVRRVRNLGLGLALAEMTTGEGASLLLGHALRRAEAARRVAEQGDLMHPDEAFCAGLFLDVGFLAHAQSNLKLALELAARPAKYRPVFERAAGLESHVETGVGIARSYSLPAELGRAIAHHHDTGIPDGPFARVSWVAERVAAAFEAGDAERNRAAAHDAMARLGITAADAEAILARLPDDVSRAASVLSCDVGAQEDLGALAADAQRCLVQMNLQYEDAVQRLEQLLREKEQLASELRAANAQLRALAATDGLTGLLNKRAFEEALNRDLARAARAGAPLALLLLDVDFFKRVNDSFGHLAGDEVLRVLGRTLGGGLRAGDVCARYGGEELVVILPNTDAAGALTVAERLRCLIADTTITTGGRELRVTVSIGVGCTPNGSGTASALIALADAALYDAKRSGRNRVVLGEPQVGSPRVAV